MSDGQAFGSYELIERIGRGGMAEVWRARARGAAGFQKVVVLKRVLPGLVGDDFAELLIREAKIAAQLHHPNIVQIFDLGEHDGAYFIAMEYVAGCDLASAVARHPSPTLAEGQIGLPLAHRLFIVAEAARALDYAHRCEDEEGRPLHIVHRDVSPQNILLGLEGQVKVADFGIARADAAGLGAEEDPHVLRGKYAYMSPEQARSEPLDGRSDLFALGVVLWELCSGRRLFKEASSDATLARVRAGDIPPPPQGLPPGLDEVLRLALAPRRDQRFATAGEFAEAVTRVLSAELPPVDDVELARVLGELLPHANDRRVNKLRADFERRIQGDVVETLTALTANAADDVTHAFPVSRRLSFLERPVPSLMVRPHAREALLEELALASGAVRGTAPGAEVVWSFASGPHDLHGALARVAHEWRAAGGSGAAVFFEGMARVWQSGSAVELTDAALDRGRAQLREATPDATLCAPEVIGSLEGRFLLEGAEWPALRGYRRKAEHEMAALLRVPLIGRGAQLDTLTEALERSAGHGGSLWLVGEGGSGKSRLAAELASRAPWAQRLVGRALDASPFALLRDLFADLVGAEPGDSPETLRERVRRLRVLAVSEAGLFRVEELLRDDAEATELRVGRPRGLDLIRALGTAVASLAHDAPVVVVLEDVHLLDDATRQLLPLLRDTLCRRGVLTLFTSRLPLPACVEAQPSLTLHGLRPRSAGRLFARVVGARDAELELGERLVDELGGVPGAIVEVAGLLRDAGRLLEDEEVVRLADGDPLPMPAAYRLERTRGLADIASEDRGVVAALAVLDGEVDLPTLAAIAGQTQAKVELAVRRLVTRGMVRIPSREPLRLEGAWGGEGGSVRLPRAVELSGRSMARRATLDALGPQRVRALHGRIVEVLGSKGDAGVERLAYHAARADDRSGAPSLLAEAARAAAARGQTESAAERLVEAVRIATEVDCDLLELRELVERCALLLLEAGAPDRAEQVLESVAPRLESSGDGLWGLRATLAEARGDVGAAAAHLAAALSALPAMERDQRLDLGLRRGLCLLRAERPDEAVDALSTAHDLADAGDERGACAEAWRSVAWGRLGEHERARRSASAASRRALRVGAPMARVAALVAAAEEAERSALFAHSVACWIDAYAVAHGAGATAEAGACAARAAVVATLGEDEGAAAVFAERASQLARGPAGAVASALAAAVRGVLAARAHPEPDFVPAVVRGIDELERGGKSGAAARALEMLAQAHLALNDPPAAIRTLGRALALAERSQDVPLAARIGHAAERVAEGRAPYRATLPG